MILPNSLIFSAFPIILSCWIVELGLTVRFLLLSDIDWRYHIFSNFKLINSAVFLYVWLQQGLLFSVGWEQSLSLHNCQRIMLNNLTDFLDFVVYFFSVCSVFLLFWYVSFLICMSYVFPSPEFFLEHINIKTDNFEIVWNWILFQIEWYNEVNG